MRHGPGSRTTALIQPAAAVSRARGKQEPHGLDALYAAAERERAATHDSHGDDHLHAGGVAWERAREPPDPISRIVVFIVDDESKSREFVEAADDVVTGAVVVPGTGAEQWEYPGRERMFFACERDAHAGTRQAYPLRAYPPRLARRYVGPVPEERNGAAQHVALLAGRLLRRARSG